MRGISIAYPSLTPSVNSYGSPSHQRHPVAALCSASMAGSFNFYIFILACCSCKFQVFVSLLLTLTLAHQRQEIVRIDRGRGATDVCPPPPAPGIFWGFLKKFSVRPGAMRLWGMRDKKMWETCVYSPLQNSQKYIAICRLRGSLCLKRLTKKKYNYWMRFKRRKNSFIWVKFI